MLHRISRQRLIQSQKKARRHGNSASRCRRKNRSNFVKSATKSCRKSRPSGKQTPATGRKTASPEGVQHRCQPFVANIAPVPLPVLAPSTSSISLPPRPFSKKSVLQGPEESSEDKNNWDMEADLDLAIFRNRQSPSRRNRSRIWSCPIRHMLMSGTGTVMGCP